MRHLAYKNILSVFDKYPEFRKIENFVETGTYKGGTTFSISRHFKVVHTIEICEQAYNFCLKKAKIKGTKNIIFHLGDSSKIISEIIPTLTGPTIYFLDSHKTISQKSHGFTGVGEKDVPLLEELKAINDLDLNSSMIIIDDVRLLGKESSEYTASADWSTITLKNVLKQFDPDRIVDYFEDPLLDIENGENDHYFILLKPKQT